MSQEYNHDIEPGDLGVGIIASPPKSGKDLIPLSAYNGNNEIVDFDVKYSDICSGKIFKILKEKDITIPIGQSKKAAIKKLKDLINKQDVQGFYGTLGFIREVFPHELIYLSAIDGGFQYAGGYDISKQGDLIKWLRIYKQCRSECPEINTLFAIGLIPPLLYLLKNEHHLQNVILSLRFEKATDTPHERYRSPRLVLLNFLASIYGSPSSTDKHYGLVERFDKSYSPIFQIWDSRDGFLNCLFRNMNSFKNKKTSSFWNHKIYDYVSGKSVKGKHSQPMNVFVYNNRYPIYDALGDNIYSDKIAVLELPVKPTISKNVGTQLQKITSNNYGAFIKLYFDQIKKLIITEEKINLEKIQKRYRQCKDKVTDIANQTNEPGKMKELFALIYLAACIANKALKSYYDTNDCKFKALIQRKDILKQLPQFCIQQGSDELDPKIIIDRLCQKIEANARLFDRCESKEDKEQAPKRSFIGKRSKVGSRSRYFIEGKTFRKWIEEITGPQKSQKVIRLLQSLSHSKNKSRGYLEKGTDDSRKATRETVRGKGLPNYMRGYALVVDDGDTSVWDWDNYLK
ncbi:hypothetical protein [Anaerovibrio lipolyticus]|uniref:hypothetical protein n=1 Tax=Anaerovibrio lipolyticus TaxID=82374 RepID=UPI000484C4B8|nr:hypothetical protein [Anaerovibrio lipolyticus]